MAVSLSLAGVTLAAAPAHADATLCSGTSYSTCVNAGYTDHGYSGSSGNRYWGMDPGHNCTNYAAYVEQSILGVPAPPYGLGNAYQWGPNASAHGVPVNSTPAAGAVAWWTGGLGHVAIVESVNGDGSITVSEDDANNGIFDWAVISRGSSRWPMGFIHFKDAKPVSLVTADGHVQFFYNLNGTLAENWYGIDGSLGGGSANGGIRVVGNPALVARAGQTVIDAFVRSSNGQIYETWYDWAHGWWGGWIPIGGNTFTSDPQAAATSDGHEQVFADAAGTLEENWFDPGTGHIGGWVQV